MINTPLSDSSISFTGRHMLMCMLAFFGVILCVNLTMAWLASRTWTGLVVKNSYVASQAFNDELDRAHEQNARGWTPVLSYNAGLFRFRLRDRNGSSVPLANVRMTIGRPAFEQQDAIIALTRAGREGYQADWALAPGPWAIRIDADVGESTYRLDHRIIVSPDGSAGSG